MKVFPFNKMSEKGRRTFELLGVQYNEGVVNAKGKSKSYQSYDVPSSMACRTNRINFIVPSNLSGFKRPQIRVEADIEKAWGDFAKDVTTLDFTHNNEELSLTYVQPIEDDTLKLLIDAGMYRDDKFEQLMTKLMVNEVFDAEADMAITYIDIGNEEQDDYIPVILVDPVHVVHEEHDPSEQVTIQELLKRSALLAIELRKEGVKSGEIVDSTDYTQDREIYIDELLDGGPEDDVTEQDYRNITTASELLDQEIDVTDQLKDSLGFNDTSEDFRINELKNRDIETDDYDFIPSEDEDDYDDQVDIIEYDDEDDLEF